MIKNIIALQISRPLDLRGSARKLFKFFISFSKRFQQSVQKIFSAAGQKFFSARREMCFFFLRVNLNDVTLNEATGSSPKWRRAPQLGSRKARDGLNQ